MCWYISLVLLGVLVRGVNACPNTAGIVIGSILCTLAVVGIVLILVFIFWRRRTRQAKKDKDRRQKSAASEAYDNPNFQEDIEAGGATAVSTQPPVQSNQTEAKKRGDKGYDGYLECKEYESPKDKTRIHANGRGPQRDTAQALSRDAGSPTKDFGIHKTSSHGSLDESLPNSDTEVINVSLMSKDIIGLGFNIRGSMRDGIFVSQVHSRGPASESGVIKAGDRILGIAISFENMVLEDALTILSYASPYPVQVEIQREAPEGSSPRKAAKGEVQTVNLNHPMYRSQSLDDINQINKNENYSGPQRTWTEGKRRIASSTSQDDGTLKKWAAKDNMIDAEEQTVDSDLHASSTPKLVFPELALASEREQQGYELGLRSDANIDLAMPEGGHQTFPMTSLEYESGDRDEKAVKRKSPSPGEFSHVKQGLFGKHTEGHPPPYKRSRESSSDEDVEELKIEKSVRPVVPFSPDYSVLQDDADASALSSATAFTSSSVNTVIDVSGKVDDDSRISKPESMFKYENEIDTAFPKLQKLRTGSLSSRSSTSGDEQEKKEQIKADGITFDMTRGFSTDEPIAGVNVQKRPLVTDDDESQDKKIRLFPEIELEKSVEVPAKEKHVTSSDTSLPAVGLIKFPDVSLLTGRHDVSGISEDTADASMEVNTSDNMLMKEEPSISVESPEVTPPGGQTKKLALKLEDEHVKAVLKDYFDDGPSILSRRSPGELESLERSNKTSFSPVDTGLNTFGLGDVPTRGKFIIDGIEARAESPYLDTDKRKDSWSSSMSSRSNSPEPPKDSIFSTETEISHDADLTTSVPKSRKKSGYSPEIQRRSGGGLSFDITAMDFQKFPDEIVQDPRSEPKGGITYYLDIDDKIHAGPTQTLFDFSPTADTTMAPSLIKADSQGDVDLTRSYKHKTSTSLDDDARHKDTDHVVTKTTRTEIISENNNTISPLETRKSTLSVKLDSPRGSDMNGKSDSVESTPSGSPSKDESDLSPKSGINVIRHDEIQGAYTVTVSPEQFKDSEA